MSNVNIVNQFVERLQKIGIIVELTGNYPWIYLDKVNGKQVTGKFQADHGFTAFLMKRDGSYQWTDRKVIFAKVREMI